MEPILCPAFGRISDWCGLWAIEPLAAYALAEAIRRVDLNLHVQKAQEHPPKLQSSLEKYPARHGQSIAVIKIAGTMMKSASSMGGASTVQIRRDIRMAVADPEVSGILLAIDSPGGSVSGTDDLANEVKAARRNKTVWAHIDDLGASAAYWVASQAEQVFANSPTALIGSIGTFMTVYDMSEAAAKGGIKAFHFATGPLKGAGAMGTQITEEQASNWQTLINESQTVFDAAVKRGRGMTDKQLADVRTGGVWTAENAQRLKLIDGIRSFGKTLEELSRASSGKPSQAMASGTLPMVKQSLPMRAVTESLEITSGVVVTLPAGYSPNNEGPTTKGINP